MRVGGGRASQMNWRRVYLRLNPALAGVNYLVYLPKYIRGSSNMAVITINRDTAHVEAIKPTLFSSNELSFYMYFNKRYDVCY